MFITLISEPPMYRPQPGGLQFQPPPGNFGGMSGMSGMSGMQNMFGMSPGNMMRSNMVPTSVAGYTNYFPPTM